MKNKHYKKILIIEDAVELANMYMELLSEYNFDITIANTGQQARDIIESKRQFDLIISDIVMPSEDVAYELKSCNETGFRLLDRMIINKNSSSIYFITVRNDLKSKIMKHCSDSGIRCLFEYKLDHEPSKFLDNVKALLI